jgi:hypothetical protein
VEDPKGSPYPMAGVLASRHDAGVIAELRHRLNTIHAHSIGITADPRLSQYSRDLALRIGELSKIPCPKNALPVPGATEPAGSQLAAPSKYATGVLARVAEALELAIKADRGRGWIKECSAALNLLKSVRRVKTGDEYFALLERAAERVEKWPAWKTGERKAQVPEEKQDA